MNDGRPGMVAAWRRWRALPLADRRLAAALVALLPAVAVGLRVLGFGRLCRVLSRVSPASRRAAPAASQAALALGRLVNAVAWRLPGRPACLTRSVTLWWLLRRRGTDAAVRIGVRRADGRLEAHAWVELDGLVLNDAQDVSERFAAFEGETLPASWVGQ